MTGGKMSAAPDPVPGGPAPLTQHAAAMVRPAATRTSTEGPNTMTACTPWIVGDCPACRRPGGLFVGDGGFVTCSQDDCPDPGAVSDMLRRTAGHDGVDPLPGTCTKPPEGWYCSLADGHDGPCPTWPQKLPELDPFPPDLRDALGMLASVARHCAVLASYEIRPYDMQADRRVWRWSYRGCWRGSAKGRALVARLAGALDGAA